MQRVVAGSKRCVGPSIASPSRRRRALSLRVVADRHDLDRVTARLKVARNDVAVAAVVAGTAEHHRLARRPALCDFVRDLAAGVFHERERRDAR